MTYDPTFEVPQSALASAPGWEPPAKSAVSVARAVDALLLPLAPYGRIRQVFGEIDALAVVDGAVQQVCDLVEAALQPVLDDDQDDLLTALVWARASDHLASPATHAAVRRALRSGPALVAAARWQLGNSYAPEVLKAAADELRSRRDDDAAIADRVGRAQQELAEAFPAQKGPLVVAGLIVIVAAESAIAADLITYAATGHHIGRTH